MSVICKNCLQLETTALRITGCADSMRWYSDKIGKLAPFLGDTGTEYRSKEPEGYINFIQYEDAEIVTLCGCE